MYIMVVLLFSSLILGLSGRLSLLGQRRFTLLAAGLVTVVYFVFQGAM